MKRNKISLIGGGQIGGNLALLAAQKELGDIIIYDIPNAEGMIKGKALDISQLTPMDGYDAKITGSSNPEDLKDSDVVIITAGIFINLIIAPTNPTIIKLMKIINI